MSIYANFAKFSRDWGNKNTSYDYLRKGKKYRTHHFGAYGSWKVDKRGLPVPHPDNGFALTFRVATRWFRGVVFRVDRDITQEELSELWQREKKSAGGIKSFEQFKIYGP